MVEWQTCVSKKHVPQVREGSSPSLSTTKVLYTDLLFKLPLISHQVTSVNMADSMWLAAKDLVKINEGEVKERANAIVGYLFRQLPGSQ